jgi:hypothetical protein
MISVFITCPTCAGIGILAATHASLWPTCPTCDGIGRSWAPGAPSYGLEQTLADRVPGEVVTLGNGDQGRIAWHMPRKAKKVRPETTFLLVMDPFTGAEDPRPVPYPSCIGVASVDVSRAKVEDVSHAGERDLDLNDPVHRQIAGRLL